MESLNDALERLIIQQSNYIAAALYQIDRISDMKTDEALLTEVRSLTGEPIIVTKIKEWKGQINKKTVETQEELKVELIKVHEKDIKTYQNIIKRMKKLKNKYKNYGYLDDFTEDIDRYKNTPNNTRNTSSSK